MLKPQVVSEDFRGWQAVQLPLAKDAEELLDTGVFLRILFDELLDALRGLHVFIA